MKPLLDRRTFISGAVAAAGLAGVAAIAKGLDPINPDISFGTTGSIFGTWAPAGP